MADLVGSINNLLASRGSPMAGMGNLFVQAGQRYGVDPRLLVAISGAESGFGVKPSAAYNAWAWGPRIAFPSWQAGIDAVASGLHSGYISQGLTTPAEISRKYAPINAANDPTHLNQNWTSNVSSFMNQLGGTSTPAATVGRQGVPAGAQDRSLASGRVTTGSVPTGTTATPTSANAAAQQSNFAPLLAAMMATSTQPAPTPQLQLPTPAPSTFGNTDANPWAASFPIPSAPPQLAAPPPAPNTSASDNALFASILGLLGTSGQQSPLGASVPSPPPSNQTQPAAPAAKGGVKSGTVTATHPPLKPSAQGGGFLPHGASYVEKRADQGRDLITNPGGPIIAPGSGYVIRNGYDPKGFGPSYPIVHFTSGPYAGQDIYIGHTLSALKPGQAFGSGAVLGHTGATGSEPWNGNASTPGWAEIGFAPGGTPGHWGQGTPFGA